jgi:hypothetical protein
MSVLAIWAFASACSDNKASSVHIKLENLPQDKKLDVNRPAASSQPLMCPPGGIKQLEASAPRTGHHKVFLKWNASKVSKQTSLEAMGYCLYRSTVKDVAKKDPTCGDCEQVNVFPVKQTACIDDLVKDGETYFYVAVAIAQNHALSSTSNEIRVEIPGTDRPVGHPPAGFYGACRATPAETESPDTH